MSTARAVWVFGLCAALAACNGSGSPSSPSAQPPQLSGVTPASGNQGATLSVTVTGSNFVTSTTPTLALSGTGITVSNVVIPNATTATATVAIAPDAPLGPRTLTMTSSGGTSSSITFTVTAGVPVLNDISPNSALAGASVVSTLTGTGFISGATVAVSGGGVTASEVTVVSSTAISVRFAVDAAADLGSRSVTVTTAGGTSAAQTFTVGAPGPTLTSITPSSGVRGTTVNVTLAGTGFVPGSTSIAVSGSGITIANVSGPLVAATGRSLTAAFVIDAGASPGPRTVTITTPGGSSSAIFNVGAPAPTIGSFSASPGIIIQGQSTTLAWSGITNATTCSINNGVGAVSCADSSVVLSPTATIEYQLMVIGPGGREWMYVTVGVEPVPGPPVVVVPPSSGNQTFTFTGGAQTFTVPAGITQITVDASGAQGGSGATHAASPGVPGVGGLGARAVVTIAVTPLETITIMVGGQGGTATGSVLDSVPGAGGFNGGAVGGEDAAADPDGAGGGGGGASDVRRGGSLLANRVVVAGGGGGGGGAIGGATRLGGGGGHGGATNNSSTAPGQVGANGDNNGVTQGIGGNGGLSLSGGAGGAGAGGQAGTSGASGVGGGGGGAGVASGGGGGGGGLFGGGGGEEGLLNAVNTGGGGGGGSSLATGSNITHTRGVRSGNGVVVITW
jgi:hypothetical protein